MDTQSDLRRSLLQEYATIGASLLGAAAALAVGTAADSIAMTGFGLDAVLRAVFAGLIVWQLRHPFSGQARAHEYAVYERRALFVTGVSFFLLALYVLNESGSRLFYGQRPEKGISGLVLSVLLSVSAFTLTVMKSRMVKALEGRTIRASVSMTASSAYLSLVLLLGVSLNLGQEWWWADPAAALLMVPALVRSGWEAVEQSKGSL